MKLSREDSLDLALEDFSMLLPDGILDESGIFLEEAMADDEFFTNSTDTSAHVTGTTTPSSSIVIPDEDITNGNSPPSSGRAARGASSRVTKPPAGAAAGSGGARAANATAKPAAAAKSRPAPKTKRTNSMSSAASATVAATLPSFPTQSSKLDDDMDDDLDDDDGDDDGDDPTGEKKKKRREQIAAASRASRQRRKRELVDLRDENKRLRDERSQFLSKIGELQMKVESMRERGSTDMRVENELLRAQLEEHKRFVSCFKRLCDGAPTSLNARHLIYKQGSDSAQAHVLGLISQSQAEDWIEANVPPEANMPYQQFSMRFIFKSEFGEQQAPNPVVGGAIVPGLTTTTTTTSSSSSAAAAAASTSSSTNARSTSGGPRQRLNVRVDVLFPGMDALQVAEFFWTSFSNTNMQQRLYKIKGIELTQLADDMPDKDTKMVYYREKWEAPKKDQDWVMICNRRRRELAKSTLALPVRPGEKPTSKPEVGKVSAMVLALSTTQHSVAPQFDNANRITSLFVQGAVTWNVGADARLCAVFSLPEDFSIKAVNGFGDVVDTKTNTITQKFATVLQEFRSMMGETTGHDLM